MNLIAVLLILGGWMLTTNRSTKRPFAPLSFMSRTIGVSMITAGLLVVII